MAQVLKDTMLLSEGILLREIVARLLNKLPIETENSGDNIKVVIFLSSGESLEGLDVTVDGVTYPIVFIVTGIETMHGKVMLAYDMEKFEEVSTIKFFD